MFEHLSCPISLLFLAFLPLQAAVSNDAGRFGTVPVRYQEEGLANPYFTSQAFPIFEKEIILSYFNPNENSETEVHISRSPDGGFVLAAVLGPGEEVYYDTSRLPRTTYYFKLRAVRGELTSDFSGVKSFTTGSKFYHPILTAEATGPGTIELKFYDRSYNDLSYQIFREGPGPDFNQRIVATDSGQVFQITDDLLEPNTTYNYRVDAYTQGPNMPRYIGIVNVRVTTPDGQRLFAFTLVDADTDEEVVDLYDQIVITPPDHPNLIAQASSGTGSVVFFLNGNKRVENEPPYSFFYDVKGDYKPGKLEPGYYELRATPYTGNNGQGIEGASLKINFKVELPAGSLVIDSFTLVDPSTGLDIKELKDGDVVDASGRPNIRANTGVKTSSVVFSLNGIQRMENEPPYAYFYDVGGVYRPGRLKEGQYYTLEATPYSGNNGTGAKGFTAKVQFFTQTGNKIQNLQAEPDATSVKLKWTPLDGVREYRVNRVGGVPGSTIGKYGYFTDTQLSPNTTYSYSVEAVGMDHKVIAISDPITVTTTSQSIHYKATQPNAPNLTGEEVAISVFPVPAEHELNLKINGKEDDNALVIIKNVQGYTVYTSLNSIKELNRNTISTSSLQPGVYFLHLRGQNRNHFNVIKFIKK